MPLEWLFSPGVMSDPNSYFGAGWGVAFAWGSFGVWESENVEVWKRAGGIQYVVVGEGEDHKIKIFHFTY